jgi:hypothetical protein
LFLRSNPLGQGGGDCAITRLRIRCRAETVEVGGGAEIDSSVSDGRSGEDGFADLIFGEHVKGVTRGEDRDGSVLRGDVDFSIGGDR